MHDHSPNAPVASPRRLSDLAAKLVAPALLNALCLAVPAVAGVVHVDVAVVGGVEDGSSWTDAFPELQQALAVAAASDEIWVAEGVYRPDYDAGSGSHDGDRKATFQLISGVQLLGGFPAGGGDGTAEARDLSLHESVLSGDIGIPGVSTDNSLHVVTGNGSNATAVLDGFTIRDGRADGMGTDRQGGGMELRGGSSTVLRCTFTANHAQEDGGGLVIFGSPLIAGCLFHGNSAGDRGGAIYNDGGSQTILSCTVTENSAGTAGGGMHFLSGSAAAINCIVWDNAGGALSGSPGVTSSCVEGGFPGAGNTALDPLFVDAGSADFRLQAGSPCVDTGTTAVAGLTSTDLDGLPRVVAGAVDMGAYEHQADGAGEWVDLGGGTLGAAGPPTLVGSGSLVAGAPATLELTSTVPDALTLMLASLASAPVAAFGGVVHPIPAVVELLVSAEPSGTLSLSAAWPTGFPPGTQVWFQFLLQDASVPKGITLSNGVRATTP
jgi:predicted outer membrane repeat protein